MYIYINIKTNEFRQLLAPRATTTRVLRRECQMAAQRIAVPTCLAGSWVTTDQTVEKIDVWSDDKVCGRARICWSDLIVTPVYMDGRDYITVNRRGITHVGHLVASIHDCRIIDCIEWSDGDVWFRRA
jgi:hypothetical protein